MGHTVAAAATVLAAFMGGLAGGAWLGGRVDERASASRAPGAYRLRAYGALEAAAGLYAFILPLLLSSFVPLLAWAYNDGLSSGRFHLINVLLSAAALAIPTLAMGATFPIAAGWFANARQLPADGRAAADVGWLYAINSAGAAAGAVAAGFWLIPALGLQRTVLAAAALNGLAAAGAVLLSAVESTRPAPGDAPVLARQRRPPAARAMALREQPLPVIACLAAGVSGLVALTYEVAWTRLLALVVGPTTYAFSIVLACFVLGITLGSAGGARLVRRVGRPAIWLGTMLGITALAASAAAWFAASRLPLMVASRVASAHAEFHTILLQEVSSIALLLLPTTVALGAVFPLALATAGIDRRHTGRDVARIYASNTLGAIAGALAAGFVLLPALGLFNAFRTAAFVGVVAAAAVWYAALGGGQGRRRAAPAAVFVAGVGLLIAMPAWDLNVLTSGAYKYTPGLTGAEAARAYRAWRMLFYQDGAAATVSVRELATMRSLVVDGKVDASNMGDMLTQRMLGLLPVLLHPDPHQVCVIGLGSGVTAASTLARGSVQRADIVEISPEVVKAARFFDRENGDVLANPAVRLITGDGRSHLRLTRQRYDVIVSEPSNPWMAGIAALFTQEFFQDARGRLNPDGLMCQWAHTYDMSPDDLRSIVRTFTSVFPESTMWLVGDSDVLLIGSTGAAIDLARIGEHCPEAGVPALLKDVAIEPEAAPFALLSLFAGGPAELKRYAAGAAVQRDDRMALEFSAPRAIYNATADENATAIRALADKGARANVAVRRALEQASSDDWTVAGAMQLKAGAASAAYESLMNAVRLDSRNADALGQLSEAAASAHRENEERELLKSMAEAEPANAAVRAELSRLLAASGDMAAAAAVAAEAMRLAPDDPRPIEQFASVLADAGDGARLAPVAEVLAARFPERPKARYYHATAQLLLGRVSTAVEEASALAAATPHDAAAQNLLGVACGTAGDRACALAAFTAALQADPRDATTYVNLGVFHLQGEDPAAAVESFSLAMALDPSSSAAARGLAEARTAGQVEP